jgi:hypothetical protein
MFICSYCSEEKKSAKSKIAHEVHCKSNPNRKHKPASFGMKNKVSWNSGLTAITDVRVAKNADSIRNTSKKIGRCANPIKESERRQKLSASAKRLNFGGYQSNSGRSKKFKVLDSFGKETCLQSTYELLCSRILDEMSVRWIRPRSLTYDNRKYFADFYLVDYDLYLDPKNDYKIRLDKDKIAKVIDQNNVRVVVLSKNEICKEHIASLIQ